MRRFFILPFLACSLSSCVVTWLDSATLAGTEAISTEWKAVGQAETKLEMQNTLSQSGTVSGRVIRAIKEEEFKTVAEERLVPIKYEAGGVTYEPWQAEIGYWLLLPISLIFTASGKGSGIEVADYETQTSDRKTRKSTGKTRPQSEPVEGQQVVAWIEIGSLKSPSAEAYSNASGNFTIDLTAEESIVTFVRENRGVAFDATIHVETKRPRNEQEIPLATADLFVRLQGN